MSYIIALHFDAVGMHNRRTGGFVPGGGAEKIRAPRRRIFFYKNGVQIVIFDPHSDSVSLFF